MTHSADSHRLPAELSGPSPVRIYEVALRDGLQNEADVVATGDKVELISRLLSAGVRDLEVTSFVRPSWIPQLADWCPTSAAWNAPWTRACSTSAPS
jgi:hydroxymethylglutaryl-CoA lyase